MGDVFLVICTGSSYLQERVSRYLHWLYPEKGESV